MLAFFRENPRALLAAVLVHLVLLAILVVGLDWTPTVATKGQKKAPIKAVFIDTDKLTKEVKRQENLKQQQQKQEQEKLRELEKQAEQAKQARVREEKRLAKIKQQKKAERQAQEKRNAEIKLKAKQEKKRKAEADAKLVAEKKRKAERAAKRKASEAAKRKAAEAALQASLAEEQNQLADQRINKAVNEHAAYITAKVQNSWIRPPDNRAGLTCLVGVRLIPSGEVIDATIIRSSGDPAFDRSVVAAVFKASPLPMPKDPKVMEKFRSFNFNFNPNKF